MNLEHPTTTAPLPASFIIPGSAAPSAQRTKNV